MVSNFNDVGEFHEKFGLDNVTYHQAGLRNPGDEVMAFRIKFMYEELREFEDAYAVGDNPGMFDALLDLVYVAMGTAHLKGFPWERGWAVVQSANMSKIRAQKAADSKRGVAYDVVKPEGWTPPDIANTLR